SSSDRRSRRNAHSLYTQLHSGGTAPRPTIALHPAGADLAGLCIGSVRLGASPDLGHPPSQPHEQEPPIVQELGRLPFDRVADELKGPARDEERDRDRPETMNENGGDEQRNRKSNERNPDGVAETIDRVLMASAVLRDPLVP